MNIAQIVPSLESQHGGPSRSVRHLSLAMSATDHEVDLLTTEIGVTEQHREASLHVHTFPRTVPHWMCRSTGLKRHLAETSYDIVHHHSLWLRTLHYAAARRDAPLIIAPRGMMSPWAWNHHRWKKRLASQWIHPGAMKNAAAWHATSEDEAHDIRQLGFTQPICVSPNSVSVPSGEEVIAARNYWQQTCPLVCKRKVAIFYSRFHRKKRLLELIDLWLATAPSDWLLLLVGIPEEYSVAELDAYALRQSAGDRIRVFSGADRPAPYAVASLFLLPSHSENFGLVIAEAMAHGVPVLVTDSTPWHEVHARECGWCVPWPQFPAALKKALAESPDQLAQRGRLARAWISAEFAWEKSAALLIAFYEELLARRP